MKGTNERRRVEILYDTIQYNTRVQVLDAKVNMESNLMNRVEYNIMELNGLLQLNGIDAGILETAHKQQYRHISIGLPICKICWIWR